MILRDAQLKEILAEPERRSVYYYYSTDEYLARRMAERTVARLLKDTGAEVTVVEGPAPDIGAAVAAAGTISLFGDRRVVEMPLVEPSAMGEADVTALCDLMGSLENAVLVLSTVFKDDKAKQSKKAKQLIAAAEKHGLAGELQQPGPADAKRFAAKKARELGSELPAAAADALVERAGTDYFLLECEVQKLAAASGYGVITPELVGEMGVQNIEADVFELVRLATAKNKAKAFAKLRQLLDLQNEPIAIAAALSGSYLDLYRVKCGQEAHKNYSVVHKEFGYRGSDWRLKKAAETAGKYSKKQLGHILEILLDLDAQLKSSPADRAVLLQTALCEVLEARS